MTTRIRGLLALLLGSMLLTGCDFDVYSLPLPGGADTGDDPITVTAEFEDVLDLVPQSSVKVNDITVGKVVDVKLSDYTALVEMELRNDTGLPDNAVATIRQTSLLGEKFVSLSAPAAGASAEPLGNKDEIDLDRTGRNPEVEEVLGALSIVLNSGGVAQLKTIMTELNLALEGREDSARSVLTQVESLVSQLDERKGDIVNAIESLNRLAVGAREQQGSIDQALEELPSALDSINRQRTDLVRMLQGLNRLGDVGVRVIQQTKESTLSSLRELEPILTQVGNAGDSFVEAMNIFFTFPFVDEVVGRDPQTARNLHMGDYVNLAIDLDIDLDNLQIPDVACIPFDQLPDSPLDDLLDLPNLCDGVQRALQACLRTPPNPDACAKLPQHLLNEICAATGLPLFCDLGGGASGGSDDPIEDLLDDLGDGLGLNRPAPGEGRDARLTTLDEDYDTGLALMLMSPFTTEGVAR